MQGRVGAALLACNLTTERKEHSGLVKTDKVDKRAKLPLLAALEDFDDSPFLYVEAGLAVKRIADLVVSKLALDELRSCCTVRRENKLIRHGDLPFYYIT